MLESIFSFPCFVGALVGFTVSSLIIVLFLLCWGCKLERGND